MLQKLMYLFSDVANTQQFSATNFELCTHMRKIRAHYGLSEAHIRPRSLKIGIDPPTEESKNLLNCVSFTLATFSLDPKLSGPLKKSGPPTAAAEIDVDD